MKTAWERAGAYDARAAADDRRGEETMPLGRCYLVVNPGSHYGRGGETAERYRRLLERAGEGRPGAGSRHATQLEFACTRDLEDARILAHRALSNGYDTVVAVGGDGTINRVVSAFMECDSLRPTARLGILYSGTSPDFCRFHGIPVDPEAAVATLLDGRSRPIDVCRIVDRDAKGNPRIAYFASSANIGLGAGIAGRANRLRPALGDLAGTFLAAALTIGGRRPRRMRVTVDGEEILLPQVLNLSVGKNPFLAGGLKLETKIAPNDGRLFLFAVCGIGRLGLLASLPRIYSGTITRDSRFLLRDAANVRVEPLEEKLRAEYDGDPAGWCPVEIGVVPGALRLIGGRS